VGFVVDEMKQKQILLNVRSSVLTRQTTI
jgi:hypothetical protein